MTAVVEKLNKNRQLNNITSMLLLWPAQCPAVFGSLVKKKKKHDGADRTCQREHSGHVGGNLVSRFSFSIGPWAGRSLSEQPSVLYGRCCCTAQLFLLLFSWQLIFWPLLHNAEHSLCVFLSQMMESPQFFWAHGWWRWSHKTGLRPPWGCAFHSTLGLQARTASPDRSMIEHDWSDALVD